MGCTCEKVWRQKLSKVGHKCDNLDSPPTMSDAQKALIRNNWRILKSNVSNIGLITYVRFVLLLIVTLIIVTFINILEHIKIA